MIFCSCKCISLCWKVYIVQLELPQLHLPSLPPSSLSLSSQRKTNSSSSLWHILSLELLSPLLSASVFTACSFFLSYSFSCFLLSESSPLPANMLRSSQVKTHFQRTSFPSHHCPPLHQSSGRHSLHLTSLLIHKLNPFTPKWEFKPWHFAKIAVFWRSWKLYSWFS